MDDIRSWLFLAVLLVTGSCSSSGSFTGFSYDPEGATITTDKSIQPQYKRTIGIREDGIWLTNEFSGARMNDFYKVNDSLYQVVIEPENHPVNNSPWYAFKIWSNTTKSIKLRLSYRHGEHRYWPDLSTSGSRWAPIESTHYEPDTLSGTATLKLNVSPDTLWVSAQELFTAAEYWNWLQSIGKRSYVRLDTVGYSHQKRPIPKISVSQVPAGQKAGVLIVTGRLHPPEVTGALANKIFLEEIVSDTELARSFRQQFHTVAYPLINPDGVQNGHWRHNAAGVDLNRDWVAFNQPETKAVRDDLLKTVADDNLKKVFYGIDFHSTDENIFYPINKEIETFPEDFSYGWIDSLKAEYPDVEFKVEPFDTSSPITKNWIYRTFGADAITYEVNDRINRQQLEVISRSAARIIMRQLLDEATEVKKINE